MSTQSQPWTPYMHSPETNMGLDLPTAQMPDFSTIAEQGRQFVDDIRTHASIGVISAIGKISKPALAPAIASLPITPPVAVTTATVATASYLAYEYGLGTESGVGATTQDPSYGGSYTPPSSYKCPADVIKMGRNPLYDPNIFGRKPFVIPPDPNLVDLILESNRQWESLTGDPVTLQNECIGQQLGEQFEVVNKDLSPATNTVFKVDIPSAETGVKINSVKQFDNTRSEVPNNCVITADQKSAICNMGTFEGGKYYVFNVGWTTDKPVKDQPIQASIVSDIPDRDPTDNSVSYTDNIYPELINPFAPGSKPTMRSLPAKRINRNCYVRPLAVTSLKSHLLNGKVKTIVSFSSMRGKKRIVRHKTIVKPFADLYAESVKVPVRVCGKNTKADAKITVSASNLSDGATYSTQAHLLKLKKKGKKPARIVWRNEPWS